MAARRAFVDDDRLKDAAPGVSISLPENVAHRFSRVLRLKSGDAVELFDDEGRVVGGVFDGGSVVVDAVDVRSDALPPLIVLQAMSKADKLEVVVQKATELGASEIVLWNARRSQVSLGGKGGGKGGHDDERADKKLVRLERIAQDAARQCLRARPPVIRAVKGGDDAVAVARAVVDAGGVAVCGIVDADLTLSAFLRQAPERLEHGVVVVVGPEGGLDDNEARAFVAAGVTPVRWSRFVLRTETAALSALSLVQAALDEA
jgi:16S rRNA (uracil1498-N3)-methyltransferase